jgi:hypothetical protein
VHPIKGQDCNPEDGEVMSELFGGKFAPVTNTIGFLRYDSSQAAQCFFDWQEEIQAKRGVSLVESKVQGDLGSAIQRLLPLTSVERRRYLFIPTRSNWTAFLDNGHLGTDVFAHLSYLAEKLACEAVRATYIPERRNNQYPVVMFELYGPTRSDFLNYVRSVAVSSDGRNWAFAAAGEVQPFEEIQRYSSRKIRDRFTPEMLDNYLSKLDIRAFDPDFYLPHGNEAILIEKIGPIASAAREFQLV